jgi:hypothetical protein
VGSHARAPLDVLALPPWLTELLFGVTMWVMFTRPHVIDLFARGSEAGERDRPA